MAGPYTPKAKYGADVEEAMASATDPAMAIVGVDQATNTPTRRTPEVPAAGGGQGMQFSMGVDAPMYGWSLNQQDMGQGNVQQIRTDNFVTPVAEQRLPFGAAAARQQSIAQRRMQLEDAKAKALRDFDQFKGISDPAAQHQVSFSKYLNNVAWPSFVQSVQDAFGLTREAAIDYIVNDPQGRLMNRQWAQQQDAIAKESAGMTERSLDTLARIAKGETELPPEDQQAIVNYVQNVGENDTPQPGTDPSEFQLTGRRANEAISLVQFQDKFLSDFDKFAMQKIQEGKARRLPGGRYEITDEEFLLFEPYKEAMIEQAVELGVKGGNREAIKAHIDRIINNRVERTTRGWDAPRPTASSQGQDNAKTWIGGIEKSISENIVSPDGPPNEIAFVPGEVPGPTMYRKDTERRRVGDLVNGRQQPMGPRVFSDSEGRQVTMKPQYIESDGMGGLYVSGELVGDGQTVTFTTTETDENGELKEVTKTVDTSKKSQPVSIYLNDQRKTAESYFGPGWDQGFSSAESMKPKAGGKQALPSPEEFNAKWAKLPKGGAMIGPDGETYIKE